MTYYNRGSVLKDLKRFEEALASYDSAIALNGDYAEAYVNRGNVLQELRRHEAAIESFGRAIGLNPLSGGIPRTGCLPVRLKRLGKLCPTSTRQLRLSRILLRRTLVGVMYWGTSIITTRPPSITPKPSSWNRTRRLPFLASLSFASSASISRLRASIRRLCSNRTGIPAWYQPGDQDACLSWDGLGEDLDPIAKGVSEGNPCVHSVELAALMDSFRAAEVGRRRSWFGTSSQPADEEGSRANRQRSAGAFPPDRPARSG